MGAPVLINGTRYYLSLGQERLASSGHPRSTHPINLPVRRGMPRARSRRCPRAARLQHRGHADSISTKSQRKSPPAHTPFSFSIKLDGTAPKTSSPPKTSRSCRCRRVRQSSTLKKTSGSSCGRTGCRTAFSNPSTKSSTTAATRGTRSSINPGKSCPSLAAIGQSPVNHCEGWYYLSLGQERLASSGHPRSTHPINLPVRRGMPRARSRRCPRAARLQHRGHAAPSRRNRNESHPRRTRRSHSRSSWMAQHQPQAPQKHLAPAAAAACADST